MNEIVFCEPVRTAVGRYGGMYVDVPATDLARTVIEAILQRTKIDPEKIDEVTVARHCDQRQDAASLKFQFT